MGNVRRGGCSLTHDARATRNPSPFCPGEGFLLSPRETCNRGKSMAAKTWRYPVDPFGGHTPTPRPSLSSTTIEGGNVGLMRKSFSAMTAGAVDWRSDKERIAAHTKGVKHAVKRQTRVTRKQTRVMRKQTRVIRSQGPNGTVMYVPVPSGPPSGPPIVASPPPGWYPDPGAPARPWPPLVGWSEVERLHRVREMPAVSARYEIAAASSVIEGLPVRASRPYRPIASRPSPSTPTHDRPPASSSSRGSHPIESS